MTTTTTEVKWRAGRDGVGHALPTKAAPRYACNRMPIAERFAWPIQTKCGPCLDKIEEAERG